MTCHVSTRTLNTTGDALTIACLFNVGSRMDPTGKDGLCHLVEHLMFHKRAKYFQGIDTFAKLGGLFNGSTTYDEVMFYISVPVTKWKECIWHLAHWLFSFDIANLASQVEKEKKVVLEEYLSKVSAVDSSFFSSLFGVGSAYSRPVIGNRDSINNITTNDVITFYERHIRNCMCKMLISVRSDIHRKILCELKKALRVVAKGNVVLDVEDKRDWRCKSLSEMKPCLCKVNNKDVAKANPSVRVEPSGKRGGSNRVSIGFQTVCIHNPDHYALKFLSILLTGRFDTSVLYRELRIERQMSYGVSSSQISFDKAGAFVITLSTSNDSLDALLISLRCIENIAKNKCKKQFETIKNAMEFTILSSINASDVVKTNWMLEQWQRVDCMSPKAYVKRMLAVEYKDIVRCIHTYLEEPKVMLTSQTPRQMATKRALQIIAEYKNFLRSN